MAKIFKISSCYSCPSESCTRKKKETHSFFKKIESMQNLQQWSIFMTHSLVSKNFSRHIINCSRCAMSVMSAYENSMLKSCYGALFKL